MIWLPGDEYIQWVQDRMPEGVCFDNPVGVGIIKHGLIVVGIVYDNYRPAAKCISISVAVDDKTAVTRAGIRKMFYFPFNVLGCRRITNVVEADNEQSLEVTRKLGYTLEGVMRKASVTGKDLHIFGMLREECKWL